MDFESYTFDEANNLLSSLSNAAEFEFLNDDGQGFNSTSPGSQSSSYSGADGPWNAFTGELDFDGELTNNNVNDNNMFFNNDNSLDPKTLELNENLSESNNSNFINQAKPIPMTSEPMIKSENSTRINSATTNESFTAKEETSSISPTSDSFLSPVSKSDMIEPKKSISGKITKPKKGRASHNMVEKKYRTNINTKILALRDAVPALRVAALGTDLKDIDLDGLAPAAKLNKASVLTKATEYIQHLEKKNAKLQKENEELRNIFSQLGRNSGRNSGNNNNNNNNNQQFNGLNQMDNFNNDQFNQTFYNSQNNSNQSPTNNNNSYNMSMPMRLAVGGMAAMAGTNYFGNNGQQDYKGLSAIPILNPIIVGKLINFFKISVIFYGVFMAFILPIIQGLNKEKKKKSGDYSLLEYQQIFSKSLNDWISLILSIINARILKKLPLIKGKEDVNLIINNVNRLFFIKNENKSIKDLIFIYFELLKLDGTKNYKIFLYQLVIGKIIVKNNFIFKLICLNENSILNELNNLKVDEDYQTIVEDFSNVLNSFDLIQRLNNIFYSKNINNETNEGIFEQSYIEISNDIVVNTDIIDFVRNLRANELLRKRLINYLDLLINEKEKIDKISEKSLSKLEFLNSLAVPNSIISLRIKLFNSLIYPSKISESMLAVKTLVDEINNSNNINKEKIFKYEVMEVTESIQNDIIYEEEEDDEFSDDDITDDDSTDTIAKIKSKSSEDSESIISKPDKLKEIGGEDDLTVEVYIALASSLILNYLKTEEFKNAENLLKNISIYKKKYSLNEHNQITYLMFISLLNVLIQFDKLISEKKITLSSKNSLILEELIGSMRYLIGSENSTNSKNLNTLNPNLKAEICDELINIGIRIIGMNDV